MIIRTAACSTGRLSDSSPSRQRQRGLGLFGMVLIFALLAGLGVLGMQTFPTVLEYQTILKAVNKAATSGTTVVEVRNSFDKTSRIDHITSIEGKDLEVTKGTGDKMIVSFAYDKVITIYPPAFLLIKYQGKSN